MIINLNSIAKLKLIDRREVDATEYDKDKKAWVKTGKKEDMFEYTLQSLDPSFPEKLVFINRQDFSKFVDQIVGLQILVKYNSFAKKMTWSLVEIYSADPPRDLF